MYFSKGDMMGDKNLIYIDKDFYIKVPKELYTDIYWNRLCANDINLSSSALCINQRGFKKFVKACGYDVNWSMCWSEERFPSKYPCVVQLWRHFEGSMIYTAIDYNIPSDLHKYLKVKN